MAPMRLAAKNITMLSYMLRPVATVIMSLDLMPSARNALARVLQSCLRSRRVKSSSF